MPTIRLAPWRYESSCLEHNCIGLLNRAVSRISRRFGAGNCSLVVIQVDSAIKDMMLTNGNYSLVLTRRPIPEMIRRIADEGINNRSDINCVKVE